MPNIYTVLIANEEAVKGDLISEERLGRLDGKKLDMSNPESLDLIIENIRGKLYIGCVQSWNLLSHDKKREELKNLSNIGIEDIAICYDGPRKSKDIFAGYSSSFINESSAVAYLRKIN